MGEIDSNIILVGDFNIPLASIDRSSRQKINNETQVLNDTSKEMDLIDISRAMNPTKIIRIHIHLKYTWYIKIL